MNIFLAPRSNETSYKNFRSTIENGVDISTIEDFLDGLGKKILGKEAKIIAWGNKESKKSSWDKMQVGDLVLFYKGRDKGEKEGKFIYVGKLIHKQKSRELALALWPNLPGKEPWSCVFFLSDMKPVFIPISDIRELGGYNENFDRIQGFMPLNDVGVKNIISRYNNFDKFIENYKSGQSEPLLLRDEEKKYLKSPIDQDQIISFIKMFDELDSQQNHQYSAPDRITVRQIIHNVKRTWRVPDFQRYFDWGKEDVRAFLESIYNDYYVGSFLLWDAKNDADLETTPIYGIDKIRVEEYKTEKIILDGQQRITALYYAIKAPQENLRGSKHYAYFYINLKTGKVEVIENKSDVTKDAFLSNEETFQKFLFPIYMIEKIDEWCDEFEDYIRANTQISIETEKKLRKVRIEIRRKLEYMWDKFQIPFVSLPETMGLNHVAEVFERINTKGKTLGTFDLLIARLIKKNIKLRDKWEKVQYDHERIKLYDEETSAKTRLAIFQVMALRNGINTTKKDILNIYDNLKITKIKEFDIKWYDAVLSIDNAIERLESKRKENYGFGVMSPRDIPFVPGLPVLAALLDCAKEDYQQKPSTYEKIQKWYWSAAITRRYSFASESKMVDDYKSVREWFKNDEKIPPVVKEAVKLLSENFSLIEIDQRSDAAYKGTLSLIALAGGHDFATGQQVDHVQNRSQNQKDHIFPISIYGTRQNVNSVLNITWMSSDTNNKIKNNKKPSDYIQYFINEKYDGNEKAFKEILLTHFISEDAYMAMKNNDFESFLDYRERAIRDELKNRLGLVKSLPQSPNTYNDQIDKLEITLREIIDRILNKNNGMNYWKNSIPDHIKREINERINDQLRRYPADRDKVFTNLEKLSFCNIMDYFTIIVYKVNWNGFEKYFISRNELERNFIDLNEIRKVIKHHRSIKESVRKHGEGAIDWLNNSFKMIKREIDE